MKPEECEKYHKVWHRNVPIRQSFVELSRAMVCHLHKLHPIGWYRYDQPRNSQIMHFGSLTFHGYALFDLKKYKKKNEIIIRKIIKNTWEKNHELKKKLSTIKAIFNRLFYFPKFSILFEVQRVEGQSGTMSKQLNSIHNEMYIHL